MDKHDGTLFTIEIQFDITTLTQLISHDENFGSHQETLIKP